MTEPDQADTIQRILARATSFGGALNNVKNNANAPYDEFCKVVEEQITQAVRECQESLSTVGIDWVTAHYITRYPVPAARDVGQVIQAVVPIVDYMVRHRDDLRVYATGLSPYISFFTTGKSVEAGTRHVLFEQECIQSSDTRCERCYVGRRISDYLVRITHGTGSQGDVTQEDIDGMRLQDSENFDALVEKVRSWSGDPALPETRAVGAFRDACRVTLLALGLNDKSIKLPRAVLLCPIHVEGNLVGGMAYVGKTEISPLMCEVLRTLTYNLLSGLRLVEDEERERRLAESKFKNEMRGDLVQRLLHSIHNPIDALSSTVQDAMEKLKAISDLTSRFSAVEESLKSLRKSYETLTVAFAREDVSDLLVANKMQVELDDLIDTLAVMHSALFEKQGKTLKVEPMPSDAVAYADKTAFWEVLSNLVTNALRHSKSLVEISAQLNAAGDRYVIRIRDDGGGIDPIVRNRLFQPGATTSSGPNHGYGLYIGRILMSRQDGKLYIDETSSSGTVFVVEIPAFSETIAEARK